MSHLYGNYIINPQKDLERFLTDCTQTQNLQEGIWTQIFLSSSSLIDRGM